MQIDRRKSRSNVPGEALAMALAAAAVRNGANAALLADADGFLVAGAGEGFDLDWIAAFAPALDSLSARRWGALRELTQGKPLHVAPIRVDGARLFFATVGGSLGDLGHVEAAADRILASKGPAAQPS